MTNLIDPARPAPHPAAGAAPGEDRGNPIRVAVLVGLLVFAGVMGGWQLLAMIAALVVMIFLHELGTTSPPSPPA